jgi:cation:H+ antiporter
MLELLSILLGLAGLWFGTEMVIKSALKITDYYGLSQAFVGITILAIGTDLPELFVAVDASLHSVIQDVDTSGIIIGNSIGSCFGQLGLVLGISALLNYLTLPKQDLYQDGIMLIGSIILVALLGLDGEISRIDGGVLIVIYLIYYFILVYQENLGEKMKKKFNNKLFKEILTLILGFIIVVFTSEVVVDNSIKFSDIIGIKQSFVGIIIIGLGTSLPELAISLNAVKNKAIGLSVGNIIGSNIFDMLIPVGIGASISELSIDKKLICFDLSFLFVISLTVLIFLYKKKGLQKIEAVILIGIFVLYASLKLAGV